MSIWTHPVPTLPLPKEISPGEIKMRAQRPFPWLWAMLAVHLYGDGVRVDKAGAMFGLTATSFVPVLQTEADKEEPCPT